ncbi:MAG: hypothetical protein ACRDXB_08200, partial [Actinomycetes bacterium]
MVGRTVGLGVLAGAAAGALTLLATLFHNVVVGQSTFTWEDAPGALVVLGIVTLVGGTFGAVLGTVVGLLLASLRAALAPRPAATTRVVVAAACLMAVAALAGTFAVLG